MKKVKAKKKVSVLDDPVVQEVREARAQLWREGGGTIEGFIRVVHERTKDLVPKSKRPRKKKR